MSIVRPVFGTLKAASAQNTRDYSISTFFNEWNGIRRYYSKGGIEKNQRNEKHKNFSFRGEVLCALFFDF